MPAGSGSGGWVDQWIDGRPRPTPNQRPAPTPVARPRPSPAIPKYHSVGPSLSAPASQARPTDFGTPQHSTLNVPGADLPAPVQRGEQVVGRGPGVQSPALQSEIAPASDAHSSAMMGSLSGPGGSMAPVTAPAPKPETGAGAGEHFDYWKEKLLPSGEVDYRPWMNWYERPGALRKEQQLAMEDEGTWSPGDYVGMAADLARVGDTTNVLDTLAEKTSVDWNKPGWGPDASFAMEAMNVPIEFIGSVIWNDVRDPLPDPGLDYEKGQYLSLAAVIADPHALALQSPAEVNEPFTYEQITKNYYEEVPWWARMAGEFVGGWMAPSTPFKFGALNKPNTLRRGVEIVGDSKLLRLSPPTAARRPINAFWDWHYTHIKSPQAKAVREAQEAYYKTEQVMERAMTTTREMLPDGSVRNTRVLDYDDVVRNFDELLTDPKLQTGTAADDVARLLGDTDVKTFDSMQIVSSEGTHLSALAFRNDMAEELMTRSMRAQGIITDAERAIDFKPNAMVRATRNMKALTSVGFGWLMTPRTILRNGLGNMLHLMADEVDLLGYQDDLLKVMQVDFNMAEITERSAMMVATRLSDEAAAGASELTGRGAVMSEWAGYESTLGKLFAKVPGVKQVRKVAMGEGSILGETRAQNMAQFHWTPKVWSELWSDSVQGITNGPNSRMFPELPQFGIGGQAAPDELSDMIINAAKQGNTLEEVQQNIRQVLEGSRVPINGFLDTQHLEISEMVKLQEAWNDGTHVAVSKQMRDAIEAKGYGYEYDHRAPIVYSDYVVDSGWTNERGRTWVHPQADDQQVARISQSIDYINTANEKVSVNLAALADTAYADRLVPHAMIQQQRGWLDFIQKTDEAVEVARGRIKAGSYEVDVWRQHYEEFWPKHVEDYVKHQEELLDDTLQLIDDINTGRAEPPQRFDFMVEQERALSEYVEGFEARSFDEMGEEGYKAGLLADRQLVYDARSAAFKDASEEVLKKNKYAYGYMNAADAEARRIDQMARGYIEQHKSVWLEEGGAESITFLREQTQSVWQRVAKDKEGVYNEISNAVREGRNPDFFATDGRYLTNDMFYTADEVGTIMNMADEMGMDLSGRSEYSVMHDVNQAIELENARRLDEAIQTSSQPGPSIYEAPDGPPPPQGSVNPETGELFREIPTPAQQIETHRVRMQEIKDMLADPTLNPTTVPVMRAELQKLHDFLEMTDIRAAQNAVKETADPALLKRIEVDLYRAQKRTELLRGEAKQAYKDLGEVPEAKLKWAYFKESEAEVARLQVDMDFPELPDYAKRKILAAQDEVAKSRIALDQKTSKVNLDKYKAAEKRLKAVKAEAMGVPLEELQMPEFKPQVDEIPLLNVGDNVFETLTGATAEQRSVAINHLGKLYADDVGEAFTPYVRPKTDNAGFNEMADSLTDRQKEVLDKMNKGVVGGMPDATAPNKAMGYRHVVDSKLQNLDTLDAAFANHQASGPHMPYASPDDVDDITGMMMDVLEEPFLTAHSAVAPTVKKMTDFSLFDYGDTTKIEPLLDMRYPYSFWSTRSAWNWLQRIIARPGLAYSINAVTSGIAEQFEGDPRYRDFYTDKIRVNLPEGSLQDYADEVYAQVPILSMMPWESAMPDVDWNDVGQVNSIWDFTAMIDKWFGLSEYAWIDHIESGQRAKTEWDPDRQGGEKRPSWQQTKQPGLLKDVITYTAAIDDVTAMLHKFWPQTFPAGGILMGTGRWDKSRLKNHTMFAAAEAVGLPEGDWTNFDDLREAGIARGNIDMTVLMDYAKVYESFDAWDSGLLSDEEIETLKQDPIYIEVAGTSGVADGFAGFTSFVSGVALSLMTEGEQATNAMREMFDADMWDPNLPVPDGGDPNAPLGPGGSMEQLKADQALFPEANVMKAGFYTTTGRTLDLDALEAQWQPKIDALIIAEPVNFGKQDELISAYFEAKSAVYEKWASEQEEIASDPKLWSIYGANPGEVERVTLDQIFNVVAQTRPKTSDYYEDPEAFLDPNAPEGAEGDLDFDAYMTATNEWYENYADNIYGDPTISRVLARLKAFERYGITETPETIMAQIADPEAMEDYIQRDIKGVQPLEGLVRVLKDTHFGARALREDEYRRITGDPDVVDKLTEFNRAAVDRYGENIFEDVGLTYDEYKARFGDDIFEVQDRYYETQEQLFPDYESQNEAFWGLDDDNWRVRTGFLRENPELKAAWDWKKQPEVQAEYEQLFQYWKYKTAISDLHGTTDYIEGSPAMKAEFDVVLVKEHKHAIDESLPGLTDSKATDYIPDVLTEFDWFPGSGWGEDVLFDIYDDVALIPNSERVWLISEAWERGVPLEVVLAEEAAKQFMPGTPLPELGTESEAASQGSGSARRPTSSSRRSSGRSTRSTSSGGGGSSGYSSSSGGSGGIYKPYLPSYQPGGLAERKRTTVR